MHSPVHAQSDRDPGAQQQPDSQRSTPRRNRVLHATIVLQASPTLGAKRQRGLELHAVGQVDAGAIAQCHAATHDVVAQPFQGA
jgi:hypothetical protein